MRSVAAGVRQAGVDAVCKRCSRFCEQQIEELAAFKRTRQGKAGGGRRFHYAETRLISNGRVGAHLDRKTAQVTLQLECANQLPVAPVEAACPPGSPGAGAAESRNGTRCAPLL